MDISFMSLPFSFPFPKLQIDNSKTDFEIFSKNFQTIDHKPIIQSIEDKDEIEKSANLSTILRRIGNNHFKNSEYTQAFHFYYKSIGLAPIDSVEYGLALANRSSVFFAVKNYKECLKDIENVFKSNYPENELSKIYIRQAECYLNLNQNSETIKPTRNIDHFKYLVNSFHKDISECCVPKPELKNGENEKFLNASNAVELKQNDAKGRYVIAKTDIEQGDILFVEEPFAAVRINDYNYNCVYCSNCLNFSPASIPCKNCAFHFYCSDNCRQIAWGKAHQWECYGERKQLFSCNIRLILNMLFEASRCNFDTEVEDKSRYGNMRKNFAFAVELERNKNNMTNDEICVFTQYAIYLVIYLKHYTNYFKWLQGQPFFVESVMSDLYDFVGGLILKLSMIVYCNNNEIVDVDFHYGQSVGMEIDYVGCGLYVSSAMINHSCNPNALVSFDKTLKVVRASRKIEKNSEITIDYGEYHKNSEKAIRDVSLNHYKFICKCLKCQFMLPKYHMNPWLCPMCHGKAFNVNYKNYAQCFNPICKNVFNMCDFRTMELMIAPNLLSACFTSNTSIVENTFNIMNKIYHKENIKLSGYYLAAYKLYFDKRDLKKCVDVCKCFVKFTDQFDGINFIKIEAYLRLTTAYILYYTDIKTNNIATEDNLLHEIHTSLNETKRLLMFYVPSKIVLKYEIDVQKYLDSFIEVIRN